MTDPSRWREVRFKQNRIVDRAKLAVERIINYRKTARSERPSIEDIFCTEFGKLLGSQVDEILDFTKRGQILLLLLPSGTIIERVQGLIADGTYRRALASTLPPEDVKKIEAFEFLMKDVDSGEPRETIESLLVADDRLWYFSLITFCVYAYVDVYSKTLINSIASSESLTQEIEEHLKAEAHEHQDDKEGEFVTAVSDISQYGIARRLRTVEAGLSIDKALSNIMDPEMLRIVRQSFSKIMKIRHKIAHRNPKLGEDEYSYEKFERELAEIEPDLDFTFAEISESFGFLRPVFGSIKDLALAASDRIQRTMTVVYMAVLYPALLDAVIYELLRT